LRASRLAGLRPVYVKEAEEIFFNRPLVVRGDVRHSKQAERYGIEGKEAYANYEKESGA